MNVFFNYIFQQQIQFQLPVVQQADLTQQLSPIIMQSPTNNTTTTNNSTNTTDGQIRVQNVVQAPFSAMQTIQTLPAIAAAAPGAGVRTAANGITQQQQQQVVQMPAAAAQPAFQQMIPVQIPMSTANGQTVLQVTWGLAHL